MNHPEQPKSRPSHEAIAVRAYLLWEAAGRPPSHEVAHWLEAEAQLLAGVPAVSPRGSRYGLVLKSC